MRPLRTIVRLFLFPLGLALLLATFLFQGGTALSPSLQGTPAFTPTPDRLAEPTLPASPSQADYGAQEYWLNCSPCHGDKGQGLTDEFRQQYPPEDQNCWTSHCHGKITYENGFTIPTAVPQLVGTGSLTKFRTAANLYGFIRFAMPLQRPGALEEEQYYRIVSFLLRQNGLIDNNTTVDASNAETIIVSNAAPSATPPQTEVRTGSVGTVLFASIGTFILLVVLIFILKKSRNTTTI